MTMQLNKLVDMAARNVVITGAAGHLGRVIAATFADLGANLILVDKVADGLDFLESNLNATRRVNILKIQCDLADQRNREDLLAEIKSHVTQVSCLVNNASFVGTDAVDGWAESFERQSLSAWRQCLEVGLTAPFHLCQGLLNELRQGVGSNIINISSIYGLVGPDWSLYEGTKMASPAAYAASKGALNQLTRWMATTLAPAVRVNAIAPGGIARDQPQTFTTKYALRTPLGRMASEDDFRGAVAFLGTDAGRYVTGQVISVDGGWCVW